VGVGDGLADSPESPELPEPEWLSVGSGDGDGSGDSRGSAVLDGSGCSVGSGRSAGAAGDCRTGAAGGAACGRAGLGVDSELGGTASMTDFARSVQTAGLVLPVAA